MTNGRERGLSSDLLIKIQPGISEDNQIAVRTLGIIGGESGKYVPYGVSLSLVETKFVSTAFVDTSGV